MDEPPQQGARHRDCDHDIDQERAGGGGGDVVCPQQQRRGDEHQRRRQPARSGNPLPAQAGCLLPGLDNSVVVSPLCQRHRCGSTLCRSWPVDRITSCQSCG
jgi:hypothetical protein